MAKKEKNKSMEATLWAACNKQRGSVSATDYVNVVLGLLFLRFAFDKYNAQRQKLLANEDTAYFVNNKRFYEKDNVFFLEPHDCWDYIVKNSKKANVFDLIDKAFKNMEKNNPGQLKGALPIGFYPSLHIEPSKFSSLIDDINKMEYSQDETDDVIGHVYEYFLRKFCIAAKSEKGEFYTPGNIVELMTMLIQPYHGSVYDPCCGSGGMFVQSADFIQKHKGNKKDITIYGQESNDKTYKLARMNLAIRGLNCDLGDTDASTFTADKHSTLRADYILANPPFNLKNWRTEEELTKDWRWKGYPVPPVSNANYAWILHMISHLSQDGTAAFLLANGALGMDGDEAKIRRQLIEEHKIEAIIVLPREMFYATDISVTLWIAGKHKKEKIVMRNGEEVRLRNRENEILFIDARTLGDGGANEDGYVLLKQEDKQRIADTLFAWQSPEWKEDYHDEPEFCYSATLEEIAQKDYTLVPSKYIEFVDHDLDIDYTTEVANINKKITSIIQNENNSQAILSKAFDSITDGLKDLCQGLKPQKLGNFIEETDVRNSDLLYGEKAVKGISNNKEIIETKANMSGVSLKPYKVVKSQEFAYVPVTSRNGNKVSLAMNSGSVCIVSSSYTTFKVKDHSLLNPRFLMIILSRPEFDRYARFNSWGSAREVFNWDELCDMEIPLPSIETQNDIVEIFKVYEKRKQALLELQALTESICPILIKGALEEGGAYGKEK